MAPKIKCTQEDINKSEIYVKSYGKHNFILSWSFIGQCIATKDYSKAVKLLLLSH